MRHQSSNLDTLQWVDGKRRIEWTFSHDTMRFHGRDTFTSQERGTLGLRGIGDNRPFPAVPVLPDGDYILTPQNLYQFDAGSGAIRELISLRPPETLARTPLLLGPPSLLCLMVLHARPPQAKATETSLTAVAAA